VNAARELWLRGPRSIRDMQAWMRSIFDEFGQAALTASIGTA
jgi:hypothetical protein